MQYIVTYEGVDYCLHIHVHENGEVSNLYRIDRIDGHECRQSEVCRGILASYGYDVNTLNRIRGNLTLATLVFKKINNIPFDLENYVNIR